MHAASNESSAAIGLESELLTVSSSPHVHSGASVRRIMFDVIVGLLPVLFSAICLFGWSAMRISAACVTACVLAEWGCRYLMGRDRSISDLSAVVTGMLLAFNLPPGLPTWQAMVGSVFAIAVGKQAFGGIGYNPFNPALIGRVFLLVSFPASMTTWSEWTIPNPLPGVEAVTTATPLGLSKMAFRSGKPVPFVFDRTTVWQFFLGETNGCLGEVSDLAILVGGLYLWYRRCLSVHAPLCCAGTVALFSTVLWALHPAENMLPLFHLLSGGLTLGAVFMATDMVTTPVTPLGRAIFGVGCGVITMVIRKWGAYPEGMSFAILIMNAVTPLINRATRPRPFGHGRLTRSHA